MKRYRWDTKYLYWGVTAFAVIAACIVFYLVASNLTWLGTVLRSIGAILSPFVWGLVIAYLLYPLMRLYSRLLFIPLGERVFKDGPQKEARVHKLARGLSVFLCIISLLVLIVGLISLVVPQIIASVERIVDYIMTNGPTDIDRAGAWLKLKLLPHLPEDWTEDVAAFLDNLSGELWLIISEKLPELEGLLEFSKLQETFVQLTNAIGSVGTNVISVVRGIYNVIIGIIVSVYMLTSQESFAARGKKLIYCVFSLEASEKILKALRFTNEVFMGFISGKILDSFIVGVLCFIGCSILRIPYALLVSVLVGITNIIPFFGPFIGAVPSMFIILTESPLKALIFLVFIVVLQQFDGNILGPKILGNRIGINGFWVLFSIILGAGLFGFAGMLLGVPVFVVIYTGIGNLVNRKLIRSGLPTDTEAYAEFGYIDPKTGQPAAYEERKPGPPVRKKKRKKETPETSQNTASGDSKKEEREPTDGERHS